MGRVGDLFWRSGGCGRGGGRIRRGAIYFGYYSIRGGLVPPVFLGGIPALVRKLAVGAVDISSWVTAFPSPPPPPSSTSLASNRYFRFRSKEPIASLFEFNLLKSFAAPMAQYTKTLPMLQVPRCPPAETKLP